jgi:hypothetical protein
MVTPRLFMLTVHNQSFTRFADRGALTPPSGQSKDTSSSKKHTTSFHFTLLDSLPNNSIPAQEHHTPTMSTTKQPPIKIVFGKPSPTPKTSSNPLPVTLH